MDWQPKRSQCADTPRSGDKAYNYLQAIDCVETDGRLRVDYSLGDVLATGTDAALRVLDGFEIANFHRGPT
jgi:hypothetical protein